MNLDDLGQELYVLRNEVERLTKERDDARRVASDQAKSIDALIDERQCLRGKIVEVERQNADLQAANNRYLKRARDAEGEAGDFAEPLTLRSESQMAKDR